MDKQAAADYIKSLTPNQYRMLCIIIARIKQEQEAA